MFIIMYGDLGEGFSPVGPFKHIEEAQKYVDGDNTKQYEIMELSLPAGEEETGGLPLLLVSVEGGVVSSVATDTPALAGMMEVIIIDRDSEGEFELSDGSTPLIGIDSLVLTSLDTNQLPNFED